MICENEWKRNYLFLQMNSLSVSVLKYFICVLCPPLYDSALFLGHYKTNTKKKKKGLYAN